MEHDRKIEELNAELKAYREHFTYFIESAAHDFHAPLRKISVLVERLITKREPVFDGDAKEYVKRIQSCIAEMKLLIDGLTELAMANAGNDEFKACDLNVILGETLAVMDDEIKEKKVVIKLHPLPVIRGNDFQYRQLFRNVLENAIKFSRENAPPQIDVNARPITEREKNSLKLDKQKEYHNIVFEDNGIGFDNSYKEKIFEPFIRLHARSHYHGSGLGLAICKKIVMNHKGIIYAEGIENGGARFVLILPESP
jgi:signal transduction histidine kinase